MVLAADNLKEIAKSDILTTKQAVDMGLRSRANGLQGMLDKSRVDGGLEAEFDATSVQTQYQARLSNLVAVHKANKVVKYLGDTYGDEVSSNAPNAHYRGFVASLGQYANRFLNRSHLSKNSRRLSHAQMSMEIMGKMGIQLVAEKYECSHCGTKDCLFLEHCEICKKSRVRDTNKFGQASSGTTYFTRSHALHKELKEVLLTGLRRVPFSKVEEYEPLVARSFPLNEDFLDKQAIEQSTQRTQE